MSKPVATVARKNSVLDLEPVTQRKYININSSERKIFLACPTFLFLRDVKHTD